MQMINPEQEPESALLDQLQGFRDGRYERISGAELARRLTRQCPDIRILLMRRQRNGPKPDGVEATSLVENRGSAVIDDALKRKSPGNYALGYLEGDTFSVFYVGRSDSDVRRGLCSWVGKPAPYPLRTPTRRSGATTTPSEGVMGSTTTSSPSSWSADLGEESGKNVSQ
jgi:hypothetical protein